jgi:branched-chain amino acid transport system substrate-binding protein
MKSRLRSQNFPVATLLSIALLVAVVLTMVIGAPKVASAAAAAKEPIKICILTPLTGPFAGTGRAQLMGAELAASLINEKGGILGRPVKIIGRDDEVKPATAIKHAREVRTSEGANFFAGIISSGVALALGPVMQELDSVLVISAAASSKITGINFNKHVFRVSPSCAEHRFAFAGLVNSKYPEIKRLANINPDYEYGHSSWSNFIYKLKQLNPQVEVVASRWPPFGAAG